MVITHEGGCDGLTCFTFAFIHSKREGTIRKIVYGSFLMIRF